MARAGAALAALLLCMNLACTASVSASGEARAHGWTGAPSGPPSAPNQPAPVWGTPPLSTGVPAGAQTPAPYDPATARHRVWVETRRLPFEPGKIAGELVWHGGRWVGIDKEQNTLNCFDPDTGALVARYPLGERVSDYDHPLLDSEGSEIIRAIFPKYPSAKLVRLDTRTGQVVERLAFTFAKDAKAGEGKPILKAVLSEPGQLYAFHSSRSGAHVTVVDRRTGSVLSPTRLGDGVIYRVLRAGDGAVVQTSRAVLAVDLARAAVRWRYPESDFIRGVAVFGDAVYVQEDKVVKKLEAKSGRQLATRAVVSRGNDGPVPVDGKILIASEGLLVLDPDLKPLGHVAQDKWFLDHGAIGPYYFGQSRNELFLYSREPLGLAHRFSLDDEWIFPGHPVTSGEAIAARVSHSYNYMVETEIRRFENAPAEVLDVSNLPAGAELYERGQRLSARPLIVPLGPHRFDILQSGRVATEVMVNVVPGQTAVLQVPTAPPSSELVGDSPFALPPGLEVEALFARPSRKVTLMEGSGGWVQHGSMVYSLGRGGLVAEDLATGEQRWRIDRQPLLESLRAGLSKEKSPFEDHRLVGVLPQARLLIVVTQGHVQNAIGAFDLDSGARRWSATVHGTMDVDRHGDEGGTVFEHQGLVYYHDTETLVGRSLRDGHSVQTLRAGRHDQTIRYPVFADGIVYFHYHDRIEAVRLADEKRLWQLPAPPARDRPRLIRLSNTELLLLTKDRAQRIGTNGKVLATSATLMGSVADVTPVITDQAIYVCGHLKSLAYALDRTTLRTTWQYRHPAKESPCPSLVSPSRILVQDHRAGLVLDRKSGKVVAKVELPKSFQGVRSVGVEGGTVCLMGRTLRFCFP